MIVISWESISILVDKLLFTRWLGFNFLFDPLYLFFLTFFGVFDGQNEGFCS